MHHRCVKWTNWVERGKTKREPSLLPLPQSVKVGRWAVEVNSIKREQSRWALQLCGNKSFTAISR